MALLSKPIPPLSKRNAFVLAATFLLLRGRILEFPRALIRKLSVAARWRTLSPEELADAIQNLYEKEADGSKTLLVPYRDHISKVRKNIHVKIISRTAITFPVTTRMFSPSSPTHLYFVPSFRAKLNRFTRSILSQPRNPNSKKTNNISLPSLLLPNKNPISTMLSSANYNQSYFVSLFPSSGQKKL